jgi:hypothetical protein
MLAFATSVATVISARLELFDPCSSLFFVGIFFSLGAMNEEIQP